MFAKFVSALILSTCSAAQEHDAAAILRKVEQTYNDLKSRHIEATIVSDMETQAMRTEMPITMAYGETRQSPVRKIIPRQ